MSWNCPQFCCITSYMFYYDIFIYLFVFFKACICELGECTYLVCTFELEFYVNFHDVCSNLKIRYMTLIRRSGIHSILFSILLSDGPIFLRYEACFYFSCSTTCSSVRLYSSHKLSLVRLINERKPWLLHNWKFMHFLIYFYFSKRGMSTLVFLPNNLV